MTNETQMVMMKWFKKQGNFPTPKSEPKTTTADTLVTQDSATEVKTSVKCFSVESSAQGAMDEEESS